MLSLVESSCAMVKPGVVLVKTNQGGFMQIANIQEAKTHLSQLVERALAGEEVLIARAGHPLVQLTPISVETKPRQGGQRRGSLTIADDFDAPDPEIDKLFYADKA